MRAVASIGLLLFLPVVESQAQTVSKWKSDWKVKLSAEPQHGVVRSLHVTLENHGDQELVGGNLLLNLYVGKQMCGWAMDQKLREETLRIPAGQTIKRKLDVERLEFTDIHGATIEPDTALKYLSHRRWTIRATLTDIETPKPLYESSYLIWSTRLALDGLSVAVNPGMREN